MSPTLRIAIIGAGPSGLTLAVLLQRNKIPFTIYELESTPNDRNQGGTLDLHPESGQLALREAGLYEKFKEKARPEGEAMKLVAPDGKILWDENNETPALRDIELQGRPEIDRLALRNLLLDALEPEHICWGKKLQTIEPGGNNLYDLHFTADVEKGFDLVIGADGAWSKVRQLLTDIKPFYSGISMIDLWALDVEERNPWLSKYVGAGTMFMFDEGRALISQRSGGGIIRSYACVRQAESWTKDCGIDWTKPDDARKALVERYFDTCADELKRVILESIDNLVPRALYMLPVGIQWEPQPGLTVVGDAAHLMTPFAGVGVNVAMRDARELANAIISSDETGLPAALQHYESAMFERARANAQETWDNMQMSFRAGGGEAMIEMMKSHGPPE